MKEVSSKYGQLFFSRDDGQGLLINASPSKKTTKVEMGIIEPEKLADLALHRSLLKKVRSSYLVTGEANMLTLEQFYNSIDYRVPLTARELADYYTKALTSRGWRFVFEPEIERNEASLWLRRETSENGKMEDIRVKITPYGKESAVEVGGKLRPLIEAG